MAKHEKRVIFILFINIKKVFNHVSTNQILKICQELQLSKSLCYWIKFFLQNRKVQLRFDENSQKMTNIKIKIL